MALKSCQVCGSEIHVRSTDTEVSCQTCGSVYDVLIHGSESPTRSVAGAKRPTRLDLWLFDEAWREYVHDKALFVGTRILLSIALSELVDTAPTCRDPGVWGWDISTSGKTVDVYHRLNGGPWEKIRTVTTGKTGDKRAPGLCGANIFYILTKAGKHDFYAEFKGTDYLAGCELPKIHGLLATETRFSVSPEVGVVAAPVLTVRVFNAITKKPIDGARVLVDTYEAFTDAEGNAIYEVIPLGTYTVWAQARDYKSVTFKPTVTLTEAGAVVEIGLWPLWSIGLGIVGAASVTVLAGTKWLRWW